VRRVPEPVLGGRRLDLGVEQPGLDRRRAGDRVDGDVAHQLGTEHDAAVHGRRTARHSGAGAARDHRDAVLRGPAHDRPDVLRRPRPHHGQGRPRVRGAGPVLAIGLHDVRVGEDRGGVEAGAEGVEGHDAEPSAPDPVRRPIRAPPGGEQPGNPHRKESSVNHPLVDRLAADERAQLLSSLRESDQSPYYRTMQSGIGGTATIRGVDRIMLGSNNYLGLAGHPEVVEATTAAVRRFGSASTGSRLLNGTMTLHEELEAEIADWFGTEDALCFSTGHQTNLGTLGALVGERDAVVVDEFAHASLRDGLRMARTSVHSFRHNDPAALEEALATARAGRPEQILVVVDSLYSMEGSLAPLTGISDLARDAGAALMVDEAHAMGLYGPTRRGWVE